MERFIARNRYSETIEVKRNAVGNIVVIHSDWGPDELVPFTNGLHRWGLFDPDSKDTLDIMRNNYSSHSQPAFAKTHP